MLIHLTVNATRSNIQLEDLVDYTGNPLVAPMGFVHTGYIPSLSDMTMAAGQPWAVMPRLGVNPEMSALGYGHPRSSTIMWLTTDGNFVFSKHHPNVAVLPLKAHLDVIKASYLEGAEIRISSMVLSGSVHTNMFGGDVVSFEEVRDQPVRFKRDESGKWLGWNRVTAEWVEVQLHVSIEGHFRIETEALIHATVINRDGAEIFLRLDSEGFIHDVEGTEHESGDRILLSSFELLDSNHIFKYLFPAGWDVSTPVYKTGSSNVTGIVDCSGPGPALF